MTPEHEAKLKDAMEFIGRFAGELSLHGIQVDWKKFDAMKAKLKSPPPAFFGVANPFYPKGSW